MLTPPNADELRQLAKTLSQIDPENHEQARALEKSKEILETLAQAELLPSLHAKLTGVRTELVVAGRERQITVMCERLVGVDAQVMGRFAEGHSSPGLRQAYQRFASATIKALAQAPLAPIGDDSERLRQSEERTRQFDAAEATIGEVRKALKGRFGNLEASSPLRALGKNYDRKQVARNAGAFKAHLEAAGEVVAAADVVKPAIRAPKI